MPGENGERDESLSKLLQAADLLSYEAAFRQKLKLRNARDLQYVEEQDLLSIDMSRPEQKRLLKEYARLFPTGVFGKLKKKLTRGESASRRDNDVNRETEEEQHVIPLERISLCKELGRGEFGAVWQATWRSHTGEQHNVAVKCVDPEKMIAESTSFLQEAAIMTRMHHENVVRLYGVVLNTHKVMMVSELASYGSLLECLVKQEMRHYFTVTTLCDYALQIATGMAYLESERLIHRDLAARNVLVFTLEKVKISDFGLSRSLGLGEDYYRSEFKPTLKLPIAWCAPECINLLKFTSASDVWAYGVTLWEMFSYGEMPWNNMTGAQIMEAVDRNRRILERPRYCPETIYGLMRECWIFEPQARPRFEEMVASFPERFPQVVRAVRDVYDNAHDHLSFKKDDLITVIDQSPPSYPDGYYYFGCLENGVSGLFRSSDTVVHLDAELPSTTRIIGSSCVKPSSKKEEKKPTKKMSKEQEREKKKALISEPVGDVRHTCHVGIDGYAFGLHQLDKKEQVRVSPTSPDIRRSIDVATPTEMSRNLTTPISVQAVNTPERVFMRQDYGRSGVPIRETVSLRDIELYKTQIQQPISPASTGRSSVQPTAPPLSSSSAANSLTKDVRFADDWDSLRSTASDETTISTVSNSVRRPKPICAVYARTPARQQTSPPPPPGDPDAVLEAAVRSLEHDLTDYSLSTMNDYSDTRPLLSTNSRSAKLNSPLPHDSSKSSIKIVSSAVRPMTDGEVEKWQERQAKEHRKVEHQLVDVKRRDDSRSAIVEPIIREESATPTPEQQLLGAEWSPEAQEAYKLLVECGTSLKRTPSASPASSRVSTMEKKEKRVTIIENKAVAPPRPQTPPRGEVSPSREKQVYIIETKLVDERAKSPPGRPPKPESRNPPGLPPKMRQIPVSVDGRMNYDNLNGIGAGRQAQNPPPVPPKPKVSIHPSNRTTSPPPVIIEERDSPGMAPAIARSALFSAKQEELVKF